MVSRNPGFDSWYLVTFLGETCCSKLSVEVASWKEEKILSYAALISLRTNYQPSQVLKLVMLL